jgi:ApaG protein
MAQIDISNEPRFIETTDDIRITVIPFYLEEYSKPDDSHYMWAYNVTIENRGDKKVQLLHRHWIITDGKGQTEQVRGDGVVGEKPVLAPGEAFQYTSGCPLRTSSGFMGGSYDMVTEDGSSFRATIPTFSLDTPDRLRVTH